MKKFKFLYKSLLFFSVVLLLCVQCIGLVSGADSDFEKEIEAFPESYKPYIRELHEKHPNWSFEPFFTGIDWQTAVDNQFGTKSTIQNSSEASDIYKSKNESHYNYSTGSFVIMDHNNSGGYIAANKLAIEYYMDPRNFLNEYGIFMFEQLSFSEDYDIDSIETVLKGTFMYNTKISYYDTKGTLINTEQKFSEVIYLAGKTHNVNPCYLASKIRIEVGGGTSGSITGTHSKYPGIYNFYNIGSNDGADPVSNGLKYSSTGTTYGRPWTSPYKSIMGGANFIASTYIAKGQYTSYLQRFNVNINSSFPLHTHQYMTNIMATHAQVYQTYNSYKNAGLLESDWIFSIPVFNNMPSANVSGQSAELLESSNQYGKIALSGSSTCYIRTGPSTNNSRLLTSSGSTVKLSEGTNIKILEKVKTDSDYYMHTLQYPVWYKVSFTYNSVSYTGYVPQDFVEISTRINVTVGQYNIASLKTNPDVQLKLISYDETKAKVIDNNTVKFLKAGEVEILAYDSTVNFDKLVFNVTETDSSVKGLTVTSDNNSITVSVNENASAQKYAFYLADSNGKLVKGGEITSNSYTFKNLDSASKYTVYSRYVMSAGESYGPVSSVSVSTKENEVPAKPTGLNLSNITTSSHRISWNAVKGATGYRLYRYNIAEKKYTVIGNTTNTYYDINFLESGFKCGYRLKAYKTSTPKNLYSENSDMLWAATIPDSVSGLTVDSVSAESCTLSWNSVNNATNYNIYKVASDGTFTLAATSSTNTCIVNNLEEFTDYRFCVSSVVKYRTCTVESEKSEQVSIKTTFSPVKNLKVSAQGYDSISLKWDVKKGFTKYVVYVYESKSEIFSYMIETSNNSIDVTGLNPFSVYRFAIVAEKSIDNKLYCSEMSDEVSSETVLPTVTDGFKASKVTATSYRISWNKSPYATSYNVYKKSGSAYKKIANVSTNYLDVKNLTSSTPDYYKVTVVNKTGDITRESEYSEYFSATTLPDTVKNVKVTVNSTSAVIKWDKVKNADCYNVYHYNSEKKAYELVKTVTSNSITVRGLSIGESCKYRVRAYIRATTGTQKGGCAYASFITKPGNISEVYVTSVTTKSHYLRWSESKGANCYYVYKYDSSSKSYKVIAKTRKLYYKVTGLTSGRTQAYKVLPAITKDSKLYVKGNLTKVYKFATKPKTISSFKNTAATSSSLSFKWEKISYANRYEIFIYNTSTKKYVLSGTTTSNTFTLKSLKSSTYYYVRVRAVRTLNGTDYCASLSNLVKVKTK